MIGRSGERGSVISVLVARHDDDDITKLMSARLRSRSKRVRTPLALLRSRLDKYPWEKSEPAYSRNNRLNSITAFLLLRDFYC